MARDVRVALGGELFERGVKRVHEQSISPAAASSQPKMGCQKEAPETRGGFRGFSGSLRGEPVMGREYPSLPLPRHELENINKKPRPV
jgi:hypothetical protein